MFSPDVASHSHSLRPKRTRQAAGADDSLKLPQAKRKRQALRRDTFEPLAEASLNEIAGRNEGVNGHAISNDKPPSVSSVQSKELTFRGGKKTDKRSERNGGALTLSSNDFYTVAQLPALPDQIRTRPGIPYSCAISSEYGYAIALTHTDALIWPYNSASTTPASRDLLSFKLPFPPSAASDPLPLAAFTAKSAGGEPGLIAISPKWGKVVCWETISNASSFVPGQTSSGVQGSIPGMLTGETVKEIVNAEPAGFIVSFSHGRVAHLTIRDQMGRPGIGIQFLRKPASGTVGGILGSIRHVFGGDRRRGIPFVRAGKSSKGQRDMIVGTEDGEVEFWNTNLGSGNSLTKALSVKDDLLEALKHNMPDTSSLVFNFQVLDFEVASGPDSQLEISRRGEDAAVPLTFLAALSQGNSTNYYIIETAIAGIDCMIKVVHPIKCYNTSISQSTTWRPKLYIPKYSEMAYIILESAIVLFSLSKIEESPSSQLLMERQALPDPFQDCIKFQEGTIYHVLAATIEEREKSEKQASCAFAVQGFGIVRLTTNSQQRSQEDDEDDDYNLRISPKSKIEQAVFFGTLRSNPLDLTAAIPGQTYTAEEISSAALEISSEILASKSKHLPKSTPSIDMQMKMRAKALEDLAHYLIKHYAASLSRTTRFQLLWNAEKLAAAQAIWKVQEDTQRRYLNVKDREMPYMAFVLRALHESRQTYPDSNKGEGDRVRHWLINDPEKIGHFVTELVSCVDELSPMDVNDPEVVAEYLREADDLWIAAYETAFKFREDNAQIYGLGDEVFKNGVLQVDYPADVQQVWTTAPEPLEFGERFVFQISKFLGEWWDFNPANPKAKKKKMPVNDDGKPYDAPSKKTLAELAQRLPTQVELLTRMLSEDCVFQQEQVVQQGLDASSQAEATERLKNDKRLRVRAAIGAISHFNMAGAIKLAEKLADTGLLVMLNTSHVRDLTTRSITAIQSDPEEAAKLEQQIQAVQDHAETYYETFGNSWAFAHFSRNVEDGDLISMLQEVQADDGKKQHYLTWFLKKCEKFGYPVGKLSWISDIVGDRKYERAVKTLESVAMKQETDLWGKRTEICLAKLAGLAASEDAVEKKRRISLVPTVNYDDALAILDIQDSIFAHIMPNIRNAIDTQAAQDLVVETYGELVTKDHPGLNSLLAQALATLTAKQALSPHQLVDVLTLMDPIEFGGADDEEDPGVVGHEFSLALRVIDVSDQLDQSGKQALRRLIWRRAMIRDDWVALNETSLKDDQQVEREMQMSSLFVTLAQVLENQRQNPEAGLKLYSPLEILDAEVFPASIESHLSQKEVESVGVDLEAEQERLREFVEKGRLEIHYGGLIRSAEAFVRGIADAEGEKTAKEVLEADGNNKEVANGFH